MFCYIHIPFCNQKCSYCRFASLWTIQKLKIAQYLDFLCKEITASSIAPFIEKGGLKSIYFWGGTPSTLTLNQIKKIISTLKKKNIFSEDIEITLETTPQNITEENLWGWKKLWINRISIWVQTLNEKALQKIKRGNKWDILKALDIVSKIWFKNISLDFIIWLPYVERWEIKNNIEYVLNNYPFIKHISVYMLEEYYEPDKIIETKYDTITYPKDWKSIWLQEDDYLWEYIEISNFLKSQWFMKYEISNYAKPWFECRHNQAYWNHSELISFWLWAYSYINWERIRNSDNFWEYYASQWKIVEPQTSADYFLEEIMFSLRTTGIKKELLQKLDREKIDYESPKQGRLWI